MKYNCCLFLTALAASTTIVFAANKPNILWITAENMGPDLGCYPDSPWAKQVRTPHLDQFAREGMRYRLAFATAPVCSPSRSAFMTGMYQTTIGAHNHRSHRHDHFSLPDGVRPVTHWLVDAGYFTANVVSIGGKQVGTGKTDLNFEVTGPVLNPALASKLKSPARDSGVADRSLDGRNSVRLFHSTEWTDLKSRQPFFAQVNLPTADSNPQGWRGSKENPWNGQTHPAITDPAKITVPPYYPDHPITRKDWAGYLDSVAGMDMRVGEILAQLETDGLADNTVVIFFADNGRQELRGLDWCYDSGVRVPLIVRWPKHFPAPPQYKAGAESHQLISLLDLTATTLAIAGVPKPAGMQSRIFLGAQADPERRMVFSARDRTDEAVNRIRTVRTARYRYIRNFMPQYSFMAPHRFKEATFPVVPLMRQLHAQGKLTPAQAALMAPRLPDEELYDLETDPFEIHNLAANPKHQKIRNELSAALELWIHDTNDQGRIPEPADIVRQWVEHTDRPHRTPASAQVNDPKSDAGSAPATLTLAAVLRDETALAGAHDIEIRDGRAYVAGKGFTARAVPSNGVYPYEKGKGGSFAIVDVKQPAAPKLLWFAPDPTAYEDAETVMPLGKDRLLVGTRDLFLFDVSNPAKPKQLTAIKGRPQVDIINGFARIGNAVFAANKQGYIFAVDVSAPDTIKLLGARETRDSGELSSPHDAAFCGDLLVVVSPEGFGREGRPGRLGVYRVADAKTHRILPASQWRLVGRLEHVRLAGANRVMTRGAFAYIGSSLAKNSNRADNLRGNVSVVDLSDPAEPKLRGSVDFPDECGPNGLEIAGAIVFAAGGRTVQAIDMSNPDEPRELGRFSSAEVFSGGQDDAHDLVYHDGHLFITAQNSHSLVVVRVTDERIRAATRP